MEEIKNCVARRTRGRWLQEKIVELSQVKNRKQRLNKPQQSTDFSGQRIREFGINKGHDRAYSNGCDEIIYHNVQVGKSNLLSKKKREGQGPTYINGDERIYHHVQVGKSKQVPTKKREGQGRNYINGVERIYHHVQVGKRNQEAVKNKKSKDYTYDGVDERSDHDIEGGKRNHESIKKRKITDFTYDGIAGTSFLDPEAGTRNQESIKKAKGKDSSYDGCDERIYLDIDADIRNHESIKKRKIKDCIYDGVDERCYFDPEVGTRNRETVKKTEGRDSIYDVVDERIYLDPEVGTRNREAVKKTEGRDSIYDVVDERIYLDLNVDRRNIESRKKASLHLPIYSSSSSSSSEESIADSNDTEYKEEHSSTSGAQSVGFSSSSEDGNGCPLKIYISDGGGEYMEREDKSVLNKVKAKKGKSNGNVIERDSTSGKTGFRKKALGLEVWCDDINRTDIRGGSSVRKWPTRLRKRSVTNSKKTILESGSISNPVCLDDENFSGDENSPVKDETLKDDTLKDDSISLDGSRNSGQRQNSLPKPTRKKEKSRETSSPCPVPRKKKQELEKVSDSHCVPVREGHESSSSEESNNSGPVIKKGEKGRGKIKKRCKNKAAPKSFNFMNILADSIWEEGDALGEKLQPLKVKAPVGNTIQRKFRFPCEDPVKVEKSESEKETDKLFADLQMGLIEMEIGSTYVHMEGDGGVDVTRMTIAERCEYGHHQPILFEQLGMVCKYCKTVLNEIHNMFPEMKIQSRERSEWVRNRKMKCPSIPGLDFDDFGGENSETAANRTGSVLNFIPENVRRSMYAHQRDGFEFLWKNMAGDTLIENLETTLQHGGTGCIISHAPGTGKSFLTIVFIMTFMKFYPDCRPMIVAPKSMLLTWAAEFRKWGISIPFHNLNDADLSGQENAMAASFLQQLGTNKHSRNDIRMVKLYSWAKERSILGVGYQLIEKLANNKNPDYQEKFKKIILEGPGLVVLDEGHTARNDQSLMWKHLTKIVTRRRIILSGTPFQNNFDELHNILTLVNPGFDIQNSGIDNTTGRGRKSRKGKSIAWDSLANLIDRHSPMTVEKKLKSTIDPSAVEKIRTMIDPFVHVHKGSILQEHLPGIRDTLLVLKPSVEQLELLNKINGAGKLDYLDKCYLTSLVAVHPSVTSHKLFADSKERRDKLKFNVDVGVKTKFVFEVIQLSITQGEKVLVFSQHIDPLRFISNLLTNYFRWGEGKEVLMMYGNKDIKYRQSMINDFNDEKSQSKVLLASIKACSEGINLIGASRVILLDVAWNPSVERQAICRAYRLGQKKVVHVYRLILSEALERNRYKRQAKKDLLSDLMFSTNEGEVPKHDASSRVMDDKILDAIVNPANMRDMFDQILSEPKEADLFDDF